MKIQQLPFVSQYTTIQSSPNNLQHLYQPNAIPLSFDFPNFVPSCPPKKLNPLLPLPQNPKKQKTPKPSRKFWKRTMSLKIFLPKVS